MLRLHEIRRDDFMLPTTTLSLPSTHLAVQLSLFQEMEVTIFSLKAER